MKKTILAVVGGILVSASVAAAQTAGPAAPQVLRGTVTVKGNDKVTIKTREGKLQDVTFTKDWTVQVTKPISASEIQAGSFIGTSEMPQADGSGRSLEVHVFPPGVKMGEGHYGWDLKKGSMMTNGTVGKVVAGAKGRELDVSYSTGTRHIVVPPKAPIVQFVPGERGLIQPGVKVFLVTFATPTGLIATRVAVGENGKAPPM